MTPIDVSKITLTQKEADGLERAGAWWAVQCEANGRDIPSDPLRAVIDLACFVIMTNALAGAMADAKDKTKH